MKRLRHTTVLERRLCEYNCWVEAGEAEREQTIKEVMMRDIPWKHWLPPELVQLVLGFAIPPYCHHATALDHQQRPHCYKLVDTVYDADGVSVTDVVEFCRRCYMPIVSAPSGVV